MRGHILNSGCRTTWWRLNGGGLAAAALSVAHEWGPLPWPALIAAGIGIAISTWWTSAGWAHDGWVRGWWWQNANHRCGDDGDDDEPEPPPDDPDDDETADHDAPTIRIRSTYTLAA